MTGRRKSKKAKRYDAFLITTLSAFAAIVISHYWAIVIIGLTLLGLAYVAGRYHGRNKPQRRITKAAPKPRAKKQSWKMVWSAECAGGDHTICSDRFCTCTCNHPARLPADRVPTVYPDKVPF
jgi:hypothetical protein